MSKWIKSYLIAFLLAVGLAYPVHAAATKFTDLQCTNMTVTGTLTSGGCTCTNISTTTLTANDLKATYGVKGSTGSFTATGGAVKVSTATASNDSLCLAGAFVTLPTSGYARGCLAIQTSDMKVYVSTEAVSASYSWKSVGSQ